MQTSPKINWNGTSVYTNILCEPTENSYYVFMPYCYDELRNQTKWKFAASQPTS